jgi:hypothetical protein
MGSSANSFGHHYLPYYLGSFDTKPYHFSRNVQVFTQKKPLNYFFVGGTYGIF